jgi:hypothetical protein
VWFSSSIAGTIVCKLITNRVIEFAWLFLEAPTGLSEEVMHVTFELPTRLAGLVRTTAAAAALSTLAMSAGAQTWQAVNLDGDAVTTEAWFNTATNTTWLAGPDLVQMDWNTAKTWASNLTIYGSSDWRLPILGGVAGVPVSIGQTYPAISEGELGLLWQSLGGAAGLHAQFPTLPNSPNRNDYFGVWYGNAVAGTGITGYAWALSVGMAENYALNARPEFSQTEFAWAVHDGDLRMTTSVPEPHESTLLIAGVMAMGFMARRRRARGTSQ